VLNREALLRELSNPALDLRRCWLTAGGALVLYGLRRETADIDLGCEPSLADELERAGAETVRKPDGNRKLHLPPSIDLFENWGRGTVRLLDGIPTVSLEDLLALKLSLNRPKDQEDIAVLRSALGLR